MAKLTYPGCIRTRTKGRWQMIVTVNGTRYYKTIKAETKLEAANAITVWHDELTGEAARRARGIPVDWEMTQLIEDWVNNVVTQKRGATKKQYSGFAARVRYYLTKVLRDDPKVTSFGRASCTRFLDWRAGVVFDRKGKPLSKDASPRTMQKERFLLHHLLKRARALEIIDGNPADDTDPVKVPERQPELLDDAQASTLEREMRGPMRRLYACMLDETGARSGSEVLWVRWEDVDWQAGYIWLFDDPETGHRTKTREGRWVPMSDRLRMRLKEHEAEFRLKLYRGKRSPWIFHHTRNAPHAKAGERIKSLYKAFKNAAKRAGLPRRLHQHDLRHRRITRQVADGHELSKVQKAAGHANIRTTARYTHLVREDLKSLVGASGSHDISPDQLLCLLESDDPEIRQAAAAIIRHLRQRARKGA